METSTLMMDELLFHVPKNAHVLEPSAGFGLIARALIKQKQCTVDCVELNRGLIRELNSHKIYNKVYAGDFLQIVNTLPSETYDYVVAVPPYRDNVDCDHIRAMYKVVRTGGTVLSFTLPYWTIGFFERQQEFRRWLKDKNFQIKFIEDAESYVGCPKALMIIKK